MFLFPFNEEFLGLIAKSSFSLAVHYGLGRHLILVKDPVAFAKVGPNPLHLDRLGNSTHHTPQSPSSQRKPSMAPAKSQSRSPSYGYTTAFFLARASSPSVKSSPYLSSAPTSPAGSPWCAIVSPSKHNGTPLSRRLVLTSMPC